MICCAQITFFFVEYTVTTLFPYTPCFACKDMPSMRVPHTVVYVCQATAAGERVFDIVVNGQVRHIAGHWRT